jgi:hypothetical protein
VKSVAIVVASLVAVAVALVVAVAMAMAVAVARVMVRALALAMKVAVVAVGREMAAAVVVVVAVVVEVEVEVAVAGGVPFGPPYEMKTATLWLLEGLADGDNDEYKQTAINQKHTGVTEEKKERRCDRGGVRGKHILSRCIVYTIKD